jgi:hypothetical protein
MTELQDARACAAVELDLASAREYVGLHEYDGVLQDLSPAGVAAAFAQVGAGPLPSDPFDAAVLTVYEDGLRAGFAETEVHRRDPLVHVSAMDLACYDREYAPAAERREARERHLRSWPDAVDNAVAALDRVPAPVATATLASVRGLAVDVEDPKILAAVTRFTAHVEQAARDGEPSAALGAERFLRLLGAGEGMAFDLAALTDTAERETARLRAVLAEAVERHAPGERPAVVVPALMRDHPVTTADVIGEASALIGEVTAFAVERDLIGDPGGVCRVGPAPASRSYAQAMMSWSAPYEADAPSPSVSVSGG